jgi:hypothetical protein
MLLFEANDDFYQQADRMEMGLPLCPVISNICMENFEMAALKQSDLRPKIWLRFVNVHHMAMW